MAPQNTQVASFLKSEARLNIEASYVQIKVQIMTRVQENSPVIKTVCQFWFTRPHFIIWKISTDFSRRNILTHNGRMEDAFLSNICESEISVFTKKITAFQNKKINIRLILWSVMQSRCYETFVRSSISRNVTQWRRHSMPIWFGLKIEKILQRG
jgi:hypothetical protein